MAQLGWIIRWRVEILVASGVVPVVSELAEQPVWLPVYLLPLIAAAGCPPARRAVGDQFRGLVVRHRFQGLCQRTSMRTPQEWLPLVMGTIPHRDGRLELYVWCRSGMSLELFEDYLPEIKVACFAGEAAVRPHARWGHVVIIEFRR
ncbi:hypothetical protein ACFFMN_32240 [Planobispora siamensis]|uniref:Uncharacterized protein n=1 Tax=Planobispora siamensis TaxID=936338 RepID=A0A8J3WJR9_9ACTN|nr:hypothetical protein [Planobispora siamensis]GIH90962.1 hypothetical protein Psi01_15920 [Planobispora siamensis]